MLIQEVTYPDKVMPPSSSGEDSGMWVVAIAAEVRLALAMGLMWPIAQALFFCKTRKFGTLCP
jgi:hypothetical protein